MNKPNKLLLGLHASKFRNKNGEITVSCRFNQTSEIVIFKWAAGEHDVSFFEEDGNCFSDVRFFVKDVGTYTVFAKDSSGATEIRSIHIKRSYPFLALPVLAAAVLATLGFTAIALTTLIGQTPKAAIVSKPMPVSALPSSSAPGKAAAQKQGSVKDQLELSASFPSGSKGSVGSWRVTNPQTNSIILQARIYINGSPVATSPVMKPGDSMNSIALQSNIASGKHKAIAYLNYYNLKTQEYISTAGYSISVDVL